MKELAKRVLPVPVVAFGARQRDRLRTLPYQLRARERVAAYLAAHATRRLQVGCGPYPLPAWLNVDIAPMVRDAVYMDCTRPLPLPDSSFDHVFSEHVIEHIPFRDGERLLAELHRILRPGGRVRLATPNLRFLIELYRSPKTPLQQRYLDWSAERWPDVHQPTDAFVINNFFRDWGHRFIYDAPTLTRALEAAGFASVVQCVPGESSDPVLRNLERHGLTISAEFNELETFVLEAIR